MTDEERLDRETLLKRAVAAAGAVYLAPVLTSAAAAGAEGGCAQFTCSKKTRKWKRRHRKKCQASGADCDCPAPGTRCGSGGFCPCTRRDPCEAPLELCGGNCGCFHNGHEQNPGRCIYLEDGLCQTFLDKHGACPGGDDSECGAGKVCFHSACDCIHGWPKLCAECCNGRTAGAATRSAGGADTRYLVG